ncbi:hypothetical protein EV421DRAFT_1963231 [Armillaria borealis]|uniref:Uncharacterized protein n=1 Tax=Armillaria borealis TaxID=47425 RepID=A0AA39MN77_9AGAR|nr:hypothetical protein EV421DRAFT_1963231 [Armillaria borealis]
MTDNSTRSMVTSIWNSKDRARIFFWINNVLEAFQVAPDALKEFLHQGPIVEGKTYGAPQKVVVMGSAQGLYMPIPETTHSHAVMLQAWHPFSNLFGFFLLLKTRCVNVQTSKWQPDSRDPADRHKIWNTCNDEAATWKLGDWSGGKMEKPRVTTIAIDCLLSIFYWSESDGVFYCLKVDDAKSARYETQADVRLFGGALRSG